MAGGLCATGLFPLYHAKLAYNARTPREWARRRACTHFQVFPRSGEANQAGDQAGERWWLTHIL